MSSNKTLSKANKAKNDEFYTQLVDVEREINVRHYQEQFRGKIVLCNCDDPFESAFFQFFASKFNELGLKRLTAVRYAGSPIAGGQLTTSTIKGLHGITESTAYRIDIKEVPDINNDGAINMLDVRLLLETDGNTAKPLKGDGDFRSPECLAMLEEADIVVTNPPFSLFREYVAQLIEHGKKFLILGNKNAVKYKEIFPLFQSNKLWLGYDNGGNRWFRVPNTYTHTKASPIKIENGIRYIAISGMIWWFTNLDTTKSHAFLDLNEKYSPEKYPTYTNYPAIEVSRVENIPVDYDGIMGVPITFLGKYNPDQFEILGSSPQLAPPISNYAKPRTYVQGGPAFYVPEVNGKYLYRRLYDRIVIRRLRVKPGDTPRPRTPKAPVVTDTSKEEILAALSHISTT